jgi:hypothetical protein
MKGVDLLMRSMGIDMAEIQALGERVRCAVEEHDARMSNMERHISEIRLALLVVVRLLEEEPDEDVEDDDESDGGEYGAS